MAQSLSFAARFALTIVIVLVILFALAAFGYFGGRWEAEGEPAAPCFDADTRERIRKISLDAFDAALKAHMQLLFDVWMKNPTEEQPKRAQSGARIAFSAYGRSRAAALNWNPPTCPTEK